MNLYGYGDGDPINNSDLFGLCPKEAGGDGKTEEYKDCEKGTSGYYAYRATQGDDGVINTALGWGTACGESDVCEKGAAILTTFVGGKLLDGAVKSGQYLRAGMRTYRNQREFRVSGKRLDWKTVEVGTHWTSAKLMKAIKDLMK